VFIELYENIIINDLAYLVVDVTEVKRVGSGVVLVVVVVVGATVGVRRPRIEMEIHFRGIINL
jgi:hypothetical protein